MEGSQDQVKNRSHLFQKGVSGNPGGRPKGTKSLKTRAREYLEGLSDEQAIEYFEGLNKIDVWKMAEGNPATATDITSGGKPIILSEEMAAKYNLSNETNPSTINNS